MAVADTAPASNVPPEWNADPDPIEEAPAPDAEKGALAAKREEAKKTPAAKVPEVKAPTQPDGKPLVGTPSGPLKADHPPEWDAEPDSTEPEPDAAAAPAAPSGKWHIANIATANFIDKFGAAGGKLAGAFPVIADKVHSMFSGQDEHGMADAYFKHVVDPMTDAATTNELGPNASKGDRVVYGISQTAAMIASVWATGPEMAAEEGASGLTAIGQRAAAGAAGMTAPAATQAIDVGQKVMDATGDANAARTAAVSAYLSNTAMGLVPAALGARAAVKVATGAGIGVATTEAQRRVENASLPDSMHQDYDPLDSALGAITGGAFGVHAAIAGRAHADPKVVEQHTTAMEVAQEEAAERTKDAGGDTLDQVVSATQVGATVGAEHDAAAVHQARMETRRAQVEEDTQNTMAAHEEQARQQEYSAAERQRAQLEHTDDAPTADEGFAAHEAANAPPDKDADYTAAMNQRGQEATDNAVNVEKGGRSEAPATMADALPPEQVGALQALRDRLAAGKPAEEAPKSVVDQMRENAKGTDDDFKELPPETLKKPADVSRSAPEAAVEPQRDTKAPEKTADMALPDKGPEAATPQTLAGRRQAAFDKAMADKIGGKNPPFPGEPAPEPAEKARVPSEAVEKPAEVAAQEPAKPPANRLSAIRAAAEKRAAAAKEAPPPERGEQQFAAQDPETDKVVARFADIDEAKTYKEAHPEHDIVQVPKEKSKFAGALAGKRQENLKKWFGDSVVKNEKGEPATMYHGTPVWERDGRGLGDIESFDRNATKKAFPGRGDIMDRIGSWFSDKPGEEGAGKYSGSEGAVYPVHLKIENPWRPRSFDEFLNRMRHAAGAEPMLEGEGGKGLVDPEPLRHELMKAGHDGIIFPKGAKIDGTEQQVHVAFHPENIKSAVGNTGDFSPTHPDIRFKSKAAEQQPAPDHWAKEYEEASRRQLEKGKPDDTARDVGNKLRPSKDDVVKATKGVMDSLRASVKAKVNIHHDDSTLPQNLKDDAQSINAYGPNGELPRGVYDPSTREIHVIAQAHETPEDAARTLIHELTHMGNRNVMKNYADVMKSIFNHIHGRESPLDSPLNGKTDKVTARQWMKDYAEQHNFDLKQEPHQVHVADEYVAHLADQHYGEPGHENAGILKKVVQFIRGALHEMGLKFEWTDQDILDLSRRNNTMLRDIRPDVAAREDQMGPRWASAKSDTDPALPPSDPEMMAAKLGRTMQEQASSGPATLKSRADWAKHVLGGTLTKANAASMRSRLALLHLDSLPDIMAKMSTPKEFVRLVGTMNGRKGRLMDEGAAIANKWARWAQGGGLYRDPETRKFVMRKQGQADNGKTLSDLMHNATLAGMHPDRPYEPAYEGELSPDQQQAENARKRLHNLLKAEYGKLDSEGREIYQRSKQFYQDRRTDVMRALEARIAETGASADTKKQAMADLRQKFEAGKVSGPYFPLMRFGDHWARAENPETGEHSFSRFEDVLQRKRWKANMEAAGMKVTQGTKDTDKALMERIDPDFVKSVMAATEGHADIQDEVWQQYLKAMPEMSMRKSLIHRKGVLGYSDDALRAFNYSAFHSAHQISRLEYGNRLDTVQTNLEKEAGEVSNSEPDSNNALWAPALASEFRKRLDWIKNPKASQWASTATKLGFGFYILGSPATAIRISSQNFMLAEPYLGARASKFGLGYTEGGKELRRAVMDWTKANIGSGGKSTLGDTLRGDERAAHDEARAQGTFSSTSSQTLASGGADRPTSVGYLDAATRVGSFMFNAMEHKNRETTMLAAYRLARRGGMSHEAATQEGIDASNKAHFNYNNYNRPRAMQNDFMKVAALFKQYPWQVIDRLSRSFRDGVMRNPDLPVEQRDEQLKAFAGYMGKMMLMAGIKGVPILYWSTMAAINNAFGDKDKPFDAQAALRSHLEDSIGKTGSDAVMDGPMSALTGAALSKGASYADLWYKQPERDMDAKDTVVDAMGQVAGPVYGKALDAAVGVDMMRKGDTERGLEHMLPAAVTHIIKGNRLAKEGAVNLRGEQVVSPEELGQGWSTGLVGMQGVRAKNLLLQYLGFSPEVVARQYEQNTSENNFKQAITDRQHEIMQHIENAAVRGDNEEGVKWMEAMQQFHKANPNVPWPAGGFSSSIRGAAKRNATADHGVSMPRGMRQEYQDMTGSGQ